MSGIKKIFICDCNFFSIFQRLGLHLPTGNEEEDAQIARLTAGEL